MTKVYLNTKDHAKINNNNKNNHYQLSETGLLWFINDLVNFILPSIYLYVINILD